MHLRRSALLGLIALAPAAADAARIQSISASPSTAAAQAQVQLTVTKSGSGNCGARLLVGGQVIQPPFGFATNPRTFTHVFDSPGTYTVRAEPRKKGNLDKCGGPAQTATVTVTGGGPSGGGLMKATQAGPSGAGGLAPKPIGRATATRTTERVLTGHPQVKSLKFTPGPIGSRGGNIMAPGGMLVIAGQLFGDEPGDVHLQVDGSKFPEYPGGKIPLEQVQWRGQGKIVATVPTGMTGPIHTADADVILTRADGERAQPYRARFEVPTETKVLGPSDPDADITVLQCSAEGGMNFCPYDRKETAGATISSLHGSGDFVYDENGQDRWLVELKNGWTFKGVKRSYVHADDDGEYVSDPTGSLPIGGTRWNPVVSWSVSPYDDIHYGWWLEVRRAKPN